MKTKEYSMREMIIDQCLGTGREFTREELQAEVNKGLESRGMLPVRSKGTILQDIGEMNEDHGVGSTDHFLKFLYYTSFLTPHDKKLHESHDRWRILPEKT